MILQKEPKTILKEIFGYDEFRHFQKEVIDTIIAKKDCLVVMPTGGGKSVCYQIPAIVNEGFALVISPLIALMKDQVEALQAYGVKAFFLNSQQSPDEERTVLQAIETNKIKLLYISPEKALSAYFKKFIQGKNVSLLAIDEAHCVSTWGHDFRPEYAQLESLRDLLAHVPFIALTATADKTTRQDIVQKLKLKEPEIFLSSFERKNLFLNVYPAKNRYEVIKQFLLKKKNEAGIIYCLSRNTTEEIAGKLQRDGFKAAFYHAGMEAKARASVQENFIQDNVKIICATIAFGMGIDKSNIRWVIHYNMPKNIESYYQEIGRAGRDGLESETILFHTFADFIILKKFIDDSEASAVFKDVQLAKLERMKNFCETLSCRQNLVLSYFGEHRIEDCGHCDNCKIPSKLFDGTVIAQKALSCIKRTNEQIGSNMLIDILRGSNKKELTDKGYHTIKTFAAGKDVSYFDWSAYLIQMINQGFIEMAYEDGYKLKATQKARAVLFENHKVMLSAPIAFKEKQELAKQKEKPQKEQIADGLFERLRVLRKQLAEQNKLAPYMVFSDKTLKIMAEETPVSPYEFKNISGVGEYKFEKFGEQFLNEIISFISEQKDTGKRIKGGTYTETLNFLKEGLSPEEIAQKRNLHVTTIFSHLAYLYEKGHDIPISRYIQEEEFKKISQAIDATAQTESLKILFDYLKGEIDYHKIRLGVSIRNRKLLTA